MLDFTPPKDYKEPDFELINTEPFLYLKDDWKKFISLELQADWNSFTDRQKALVSKNAEMVQEHINEVIKLL